MKNEKDLRLVNIYIKIHNKRNLTMDDLAYLAKYNPVCFKKTCDNLIYKVPETKAFVKPPEETLEPEIQKKKAEEVERKLFEMTAEEKFQSERMIRQFIEGLKEMEASEMDPLQGIDVEQVKDLLGDLFMENLFPHTGTQGYFDVSSPAESSVFNVRV